jgi:superfamily II DNA/RNA helicase
MMRFDEFDLDETILEAIGYMGFKNATPIQEQAIPQIIAGRDLIACAQTGTGKTAAFLIPVLNAISNNKDKGALIIVPTRELAIQIDQQIQGLGYFLGISSLAIYGGGDGSEWDKQKKSLKEGINIIVATPGKLLSHINLGYANFSNIDFLVLDEADRMMDMGFRDDINKIISKLPKKRQNLLFSATMPPKIRELSEKIMDNPFQINLALSKPAEGVLQAAYLIHDEHKPALIADLIADKPAYSSIIIFSSKKKNIPLIIRALQSKKIPAESISSDLDQKEREKTLQQFRAKNIRVLVATDVISRGIDIKEINLVINYDVPGNAEDYVHRVGRTARAETTGVAITLVNPKDMRNFSDIEKLIETDIYKVPLPEKFGPAPQWSTANSSKPYKKKTFKKKN